MSEVEGFLVENLVSVDVGALEGRRESKTLLKFGKTSDKVIWGTLRNTHVGS